jgi:hypothetical protein
MADSAQLRTEGYCTGIDGQLKLVGGTRVDIIERAGLSEGSL